MCSIQSFLPKNPHFLAETRGREIRTTWNNVELAMQKDEARIFVRNVIRLYPEMSVGVKGENLGFIYSPIKIFTDFFY